MFWLHLVPSTTSYTTWKFIFSIKLLFFLFIRREYKKVNNVGKIWDNLSQKGGECVNFISPNGQYYPVDRIFRRGNLNHRKIVGISVTWILISTSNTIKIF